jgi:glycosyltransferase involved in cell wall biosynthesis
MAVDRPLVSCIMPTRNRRQMVGRAIAQFLAQDYPRRELLIVDDGDDPIADLVPADPLVRYLRCDGRMRLGAKRNMACEAAAGDLIAHWDDDDWMAPWRLSYQVGELLRAGVELCGLERLFFYAPTADRAWEYVYAGRRRPWLAGGSFCYTRACWERRLFQPVDIGEDVRFLWGRPPISALALADTRFYVATIHDGNTSPKQTGDPQWRPLPPAAVRGLMGEAQPDRERRPGLAPGALATQEAPMAPDPHVTVSIPYYRCRPFVRRAVESMLGQTHGELTVVVVNDGDPEPPWDELRHIDDPRLVRFDLEANHGRYFADAVVLEASDAPYFLVQDADDWSEPDRVAALLRRLREEHAGAAVSAMYHYGVVRRKVSFPSVATPPGPQLVHRASHCGLFRRDLLLALGGSYGGFRVGYDTLLVAMLGMASHIGYTDEPLYHRLIRADSLSKAAETGMQSLHRAQTRVLLETLYRQALAEYGAYIGGAIERSELVQRLRAIGQHHVTGPMRAALEREAGRLRSLLQLRLGVENPLGPDLQRILARPLVDRNSWTISPGLAVALAEHLARQRPQRILEAGSGVSTAVLASYAAQSGARLVSLEHDPLYYARTAGMLEELGLREQVDLRLAPLVQLGDSGRLWYSHLPDEQFDFVFVDGPPLRCGRGGALFALAERLAAGWELWLHDGKREHERDCVRLWGERFPIAAALDERERGLWVLRHATGLAAAVAGG